MQAGLKVSVPLQNDKFPDGLDQLSATDKLKVEESNQLYEQVQTEAYPHEEEFAGKFLGNFLNSIETKPMHGNHTPSLRTKLWD